MGIMRFSPEAPIPVLRVERDSAMLGGVGNVARNVAALGGRARLIDFDNPTNNDFLVVRQLTIQGANGKTIRP